MSLTPSGLAVPRLKLPRVAALARALVPPAGAGLVLGVLVEGGVHSAATLIGALVAGAAVVAAARRPGAALGVVVVYVPFQVALLALLYRHGVPASVVRNLGYVKEAMLAGIVLAALREVWQSATRVRFDALDAVAAGYLGIATVYLLMPFAFTGSFGGQPFQIRFNAWRLDCLFVVLMLAARRVRLSAAVLRRLRTAVFVVAAVLAGFAVWEFVAQTSFNTFLVQTLRMPQYRADILNVPYTDPTQLITQGSLGGVSWVRVGSLLNDPLELGFLLLIPLGLGLERLSAARLRTATVAATLAAAVALLFTLTRSAILGGLLAAMLSVGLGVRRRSPGRIRLVIALVAGAIAVAPIAGQTSVQARFFGVSGAQNTDNQEHLTASTDAFSAVLHHPAGYGLGANPVTGLRFDSSIARTSENSYLQVGTELGVAAMLLFIAMFLLLLARLRRVWTGDDDPSGLGGGMWLAGWALAFGGMFLHVWTSFPVALTFWGLAGAVLGSAPSPRDVAGVAPQERAPLGAPAAGTAGLRVEEAADRS